MPAENLLSETWNGLLDLVYPPRCLVCRDFGPEVVCAECRADFQPLSTPICRRCGEMIAAMASGFCLECESRPLYFRQARAAGRYDGALRQAIVNLKYGGKRRLGDPLGRFLGEFLREGPFDDPPTDLIVPVPLHRSRLRSRGFNQSALIARAAGQAAGIEVVEDALTRTRNTRPQASLRASEREKNVRDAFAVRRRESVRGKVVLIVDDVLTTLHTVDECARALSAAGARDVLATAVARGI